MGKFHISLKLTTAKRHRQKISSDEAKGVFLWIGSANVVDWIIGYHYRRGWMADNVYYTGNHWLKDLLIATFGKYRFIRLTQFL